MNDSSINFKHPTVSLSLRFTDFPPALAWACYERRKGHIRLHKCGSVHRNYHGAP